MGDKTPEEIAAEEAAQKAADDLSAAKEKTGDLDDRIADDIDTKQEEDMLWLKQQLLEQAETIKELKAGQPVMAEIQTRQAEITEALKNLTASISDSKGKPEGNSDQKPKEPESQAGKKEGVDDPSEQNQDQEKPKPKPKAKAQGRIIM